jgi:hypothetical protein
VSVVVVYSGVASELVRARETFFAAAERAGEWLLAGVRADVASLLVKVRADKGLGIREGRYLMFEPAERSCAFWIRALVGTGEDLVLGLRG